MQKKKVLQNTQISNDILILKKHKHIYDLFIKTGELVNFHLDIQNELLGIFKKRKPFYDYNRRCAACVAEFLVHVYSEYKNEL